MESFTDYENTNLSLIHRETTLSKKIQIYIGKS